MGGTLTLNGGALSSAALNLSNTGTVQIAADTTANVLQTGGTLNIATGRTLSGNLAINGGQTNNSGVKSGAVTVGGGVLSNVGTVTGTVDVSNGAVRNGRRGIGVELKASYYRQAVRNVESAAAENGAAPDQVLLELEAPDAREFGGESDEDVA